MVLKLKIVGINQEINTSIFKILTIIPVNHWEIILNIYTYVQKEMRVNQNGTVQRKH